MEKTSHLTLPALILGGLIALGPATAGYFIHKGMVESKDRERFVTVKGLVERVVKSDQASWDVTFLVAGDDVQKLTQDYAVAMDKVEAFLKDHGFEASEISKISPNFTNNRALGYGSDKAEPYNMRGGFTVQSAKVELVETTHRDMLSLLQQGVGVVDLKPTYRLSTFNALRPEILAEATRNARQMAEQFAKDSSSRVGAIRRANQGIITLLSPTASPNQEWNAGEDSLMKKVRVVSTFDFFLE
ncbi:MAG: hypothetical protein C0514_07755 [Candidatus Puniceispirillum sp.]|nr:hypothetical protein [Candidatus Puniceispirillum sp.]